MHNTYLQIVQLKIKDKFDILKSKIKDLTDAIKKSINKYWFRGVMLGILVWMFLIKDVSINLNLKAIESTNFQISQQNLAPQTDIHPENTSLYKNKNKNKKPKAVTTSSKGKGGNLMNTYSNLPFDGTDKKLSESAKKRAAKRKKQLDYVKKYAPLAKSEASLYGIPASITLAQGLLESNVGDSRLARKNNNHFGIKCFSRKCSKGHCSNFTDDSHKDFFRKYANVSASYRAHSKLIKNGKRYRSLFKLEKTNYKGWANGLRKAGYATDKKYGIKLIRLIDGLGLDEYDK